MKILAGTTAVNRVQAEGHRHVLTRVKNHFGADFEDRVDQSGIELLCRARRSEELRREARFFKPRRQIIESISDNPQGPS